MLAAFVVLAVGWAGSAVADEAPTIAIDQPLTGSFTNDLSPAFSGTTDDALDSIILKIYEGPNASGSPLQTSGEIAPDPVGPNEARWEIAPASPLEPGEYTAVAEQTNATSETGASAPVTFTVDTTEPAVSIDAPASPTNDSTPTLTGAAGVEAGDEANVAVTIHEGASLAGAVAASGGASLSGGGWSFTPAKLADGTYTAQAVQEDQAGNVGRSDAVTFTVDTKSPTVAINPVAVFTNDTTPTLTGAAGVSSGDLASVTVTIYEGGTTAGQALATKSVTPTGSTWSFTAPKALAQGTYTAQAVQEDQAGNVGESAAVTFTVDTSAPAVSINSVAAFTSDPTPALTGGAGVASGDVPSVTVTIFEGGSTGGKVAVSEVVAAGGSSWSFTAGKALAQGTYTAQATQEDKAGNLGTSAAVTFTVDTTAPAVTINSLASPTKNATPTLSGGAGTASGDQASVTVTVYEGSSASGKVVASETVTPAAGAWSWSLAKLLDGTYTAQATQKDQAGNLGKSAAMTFVLDTSAPAVSINPVAAFTSDTTPTLTGAAGVTSGDAAAVTVTIYEGSSTAGKVAASESVVPAGSTWSFTPGKALAQGTYTAQATQEDKAGNLSKTIAVTFTVDTTAPSVSTGAVLTPTRNATPMLSGAAGVALGDQASVQVTIYEGGAVGGTVVQFTTATRSGSSWSWLVGKLPDGTYTAQAVQEDQAGNVGKSNVVTFTVDTSAPAVSLNAPAPFTSDTTPTFSGGAGTAIGDLASVTVTLYEGGSTSGKVAASEAVTPSGAGWSYTPPKALAQGTYTVQATQEDKAGNIGKSAAATLAIDTTAPIVSISPVTTPTKNASPSFTGSAGELSGDQASVTVTIFKGVPEEEHVAQSVGVSVSGGGWSYSASPALSDGPYTVQVSQRDAAGNVATHRIAFTIDTVAPVVSIDSVSTPSKNQTPKLLGGAGIASGDHATVTVNLYKGEAAAGTPIESVPATVAAGAWSHTTPSLADGTYTAQTTQEDSAGNVGKSTAVTFTVDTTAPTVAVTPVTTPTKNQTPTISGVAGVASGDQSSVTVTVYKGGSASGGEVLESKVVTPSGSTWSFTLGKTLTEGTYTAQATQEDKAGNLGKSAAVTFAVDTTAPSVAVEVPSASQTFHISQPTFTGRAGVAAGDISSVTLEIYEGPTATGTPVETLVAQREGEHWKAASNKELSNGKYTAQAEQSDAAGNLGVSSPVQFEVKTKLSLDEFGLQRAGDAQTEFLTGPAPSFDGTAASGPGSSPTVTVTIYSGLSASSQEVRTLSVTRSGSRWTSMPVSPVLPDGSYTVRATQGAEVSEEFTFTVDGDAPNVTLTSPASGSATSGTSETVSGGLGTASGDKPEATVKLYAGSGPGGAVVQSRTVEGSGGSWSASFEGLAPGAYTAQAEQRDEVENVGLSEPVTFTVLAPTVVAPPATPSVPAASFRWVPAAPHPGEPVTLISTSTDSGSSIAGFAWALAGDEAFAAGESTLTTTFATAGAHVVQLRVTDADGQSSTVAETIPVTAAPPTLMQPFPVVRIAGSFTSSGAKISLLTVLAPVGATVKVTCQGGGCAIKSQHMVIASGAKSKAGTVLVNFRRFERTLHAGAALGVWVSNHGQIGKFTRFLIRRGKTPTRTDMCLNPAGTKPIVCPS